VKVLKQGWPVRLSSFPRGCFCGNNTHKATRNQLFYFTGFLPFAAANLKKLKNMTLKLSAGFSAACKTSFSVSRVFICFY